MIKYVSITLLGFMNLFGLWVSIKSHDTFFSILFTLFLLYDAWYLATMDRLGD